MSFYDKFECLTANLQYICSGRHGGGLNAFAVAEYIIARHSGNTIQFKEYEACVSVVLQGKGKAGDTFGCGERRYSACGETLIE